MAIFYQNFGFDLAVGRRFVGQFRTRLLSSNRNMDPIRPTTTTTTNISRRPPLIGYAFCRAARSVSHFGRAFVHSGHFLLSKSKKKKTEKKNWRKFENFSGFPPNLAYRSLVAFSLSTFPHENLSPHTNTHARALSLSLCRTFHRLNFWQISINTKKFSTVFSLFSRTPVQQDHIATHTREKSYKCSYCPEEFIWRSNMYAHQKKCHPMEWSEDRKRKGPFMAESWDRPLANGKYLQLT